MKKKTAMKKKAHILTHTYEEKEDGYEEDLASI